ncbi:Hypothetical_protein [Hexamita inflata]|uniref:Hypothetical_protein n=1 Tax=Hexamita inflata TaxID=28002 RepID=A0AA86R6N3_9EUKA|nr:Hypothetical protein HINF_LOCUS55841 [Hexamita inflata]
MLSKYNKCCTTKTQTQPSLKTRHAYLEINFKQQPKLRQCVSTIKTSSSSVLKLECNDSQLCSVQMNQEKWSELVSEESKFDVQDTNMTQVFASFNQLNYNVDWFNMSNMLKQNISGLVHKNQRLTDLLILASSQQASLENLQSKLMGHIVSLKDFD